MAQLSQNSARDRIADLCELFERAWRSGDNPQIEEYLKLVSENIRGALYLGLLNVELRERRAAGEAPYLEEYTAKHPRYSSEAQSLFLNTTVNFQDASSLPDEISNTDRPARQFTQLGDYRIIRQLGRGGMGIVFEAIHVTRGDRVALKVLPNLTGALLHRFKREFRAVNKLNHPNLVGLHTLETDGSQWFFTMDLIEGVSFYDYVRPGNLLDESRLRCVLAQLINGVMALHEKQIVHRDLKPSNVMVSHAGQLIILDFGLVLEESGLITESLAAVAGTPIYMAPEQAAGQIVGPPADWYAVGVMLYEALTGKPPFSGPLLTVIRDKQKLSAPPLRNTGECPQDIIELTMLLLAREPHERPTAFEIKQMLASEPLGAVTSAGLANKPIIGRETQLAELNAILRTVEQTNEPQIAFISGRSGEGKSVLAEAFLAPLRHGQNLAVMAGRCYDRESVPFKALDALIDALASYLRALPPEDAALLVPDDVGVLTRVFPVLQRVAAIAKSADMRIKNLDEQQIRQRAFRALRSLLGRISLRSRAIWFIDDLQWGDADSALALFEILRPPEAPPIVFLGTFRSDETEGSAFLQKWQELQATLNPESSHHEIKVAPLSPEQCTQVVLGLVGVDDATVRTRAVQFAKETRGNPFLLTELVSCFDSETASFHPVPLNEVLERKLTRLPVEAAPLLEAIAVSGQALPLKEATSTAGYQSIPMAMITRMCNEHIIRLLGSDDSPSLDTYHDRVRETVLENMDQARCQQLHKALAEVIEQGAGEAAAELLRSLEPDATISSNVPHNRVFDLAYHFDAAGEADKAWKYGLLAAEQAREQSALEVASNNFAIARRNADNASHAVQYRIGKGWGEALMLLGHYEAADQQLAGIVDTTNDALETARIESLRGQIAFNQGAMSTSIAYYERALRRLSYRVPQTTISLGISIVNQSLVQLLHMALPRRASRHRPNIRTELVVSILFHCCRPYAFQNMFKMLWGGLAALNFAERLPRSKALATGYANHGVVLSLLGSRRLSADFRKRSLAIAHEFNDAYLKGSSLSYSGIGHCAAANFEEGMKASSDAVAAFEKAGGMWDRNVSLFHRACCHFGAGDLEQALADAKKTFELAVQIDDSRMLCASYLWARATRGNLPFDEIRKCFPDRPDDIMSSIHGMMAEGHWHRFHGRTEESLAAFQTAARAVWKHGCINFHMVLAWIELAAALRLHAAFVKDTDCRLSEMLYHRALHMATWSAGVTRFFIAAYPSALRELSLNLMAHGKLTKALKVAQKSCAVARVQNAKYEHAQSSLVRAQIAHKLGHPGAEEEMRLAETTMRAMEPEGVVRL